LVQCKPTHPFTRLGISCSLLNNFGSEFSSLAILGVIGLTSFLIFKKYAVAINTRLGRVILFIKSLIEAICCAEALLGLLEGSSMEALRWSFTSLYFRSNTSPMIASRVIAVVTIIGYSCFLCLLILHLRSVNMIAKQAEQSTKKTTEPRFRYFKFLLEEYPKDCNNLKTWRVYLPAVIFTKSVLSQLVLVTFSEKTGVVQIYLLLIIEITGTLLVYLESQSQIGWNRFARIGTQLTFIIILIPYIIINSVNPSIETRESVYSWPLSSAFTCLVVLALSIEVYMIYTKIRHYCASKNKHQVSTVSPIGAGNLLGDRRISFISSTHKINTRRPSAAKSLYPVHITSQTQMRLMTGSNKNVVQTSRVNSSSRIISINGKEDEQMHAKPTLQLNQPSQTSIRNPTGIRKGSRLSSITKVTQVITSNSNLQRAGTTGETITDNNSPKRHLTPTDTLSNRIFGIDLFPSTSIPSQQKRKVSLFSEDQKKELPRIHMRRGSRLRQTIGVARTSTELGGEGNLPSQTQLPVEDEQVTPSNDYQI